MKKEMKFPEDIIKEKLENKEISFEEAKELLTNLLGRLKNEWNNK